MITDRDIIDWKHGDNEELIGVQLFPDPKPRKYDAAIVNEMRHDYNEWCREHMGPGGEKWCTDGVTVFSYRILFTDSVDAMAFKLRFGL